MKTVQLDDPPPSPSQLRRRPPPPPRLSESSSIFRPGKQQDQDCLRDLDTTTTSTGTSLFQDWPLDEPHYHRIFVIPSTSVHASGSIIHTTTAHNTKSSSCAQQTNATTLSRHGLYRCLLRVVVDEENNNDAQFHPERNKPPQQQTLYMDSDNDHTFLLLGGFECVVQGDEMFQVLSPSSSSSEAEAGSGSGVVLRITDLSSKPPSVFTLQTGDVFFARNGRKVRWEFLHSMDQNPSLALAATEQVSPAKVDTSEDDDRNKSKSSDHGTIQKICDDFSFLKVFYGFKSDGYEQRITTTEKPAVHVHSAEVADTCNNSDDVRLLPPMIHFRWNNNETTTSNNGFQNENDDDNLVDPTVVELEDWPFANPKSDYKILSTGTMIPRTSGKMFDAQTFHGPEGRNEGGASAATSTTATANAHATRSTRFGLWRCTPGTFECTEQGNELMTVVKGQVTIRDVETKDTVTVRAGQTIFLQHHGRRVVWDIPSPSALTLSSDDDDEAYDGVLKIFYGSIEGTY